MKKTPLLLVIIIVFLSFSACRSHKVLSTAKSTEKKDSIRIEYREKVVYVPDTVTIYIPEKTAERTIKDSVSFLSNPFASSEARITTKGELFHSLILKEQKRAVEVKTQIKEVEKIVYKDKIVKEVEKVVVEKQPTLFQRLFGFSSKTVFILVLLFLVYKAAKYLYRRFIRKE